MLAGARAAATVCRRRRPASASRRLANCGRCRRSPRPAAARRSRASLGAAVGAPMRSRRARSSAASEAPTRPMRRPRRVRPRPRVAAFPAVIARMARGPSAAACTWHPPRDAAPWSARACHARAAALPRCRRPPRPRRSERRASTLRAAQCRPAGRGSATSCQRTLRA
eukprot:3833114-Prymnesium_polylepis.1